MNTTDIIMFQNILCVFSIRNLDLKRTHIHSHISTNSCLIQNENDFWDSQQIRWLSVVRANSWYHGHANKQWWASCLWWSRRIVACTVFSFGSWTTLDHLGTQSLDILKIWIPKSMKWGLDRGGCQFVWKNILNQIRSYGHSKVVMRVRWPFMKASFTQLQLSVFEGRLARKFPFQ